MKRTTIVSLFICFTIIGTLAHESGHYLAATSFHCKPVLHYDRTTVLGDPAIVSSRHTIIIVAGILSTIGIGSIALLLLILFKNRLSYRVRAGLVMITLFWSRELFVWFRDAISKKYIFPADTLSDEQKMSLHYGLNPGFFSTLLGISSLIICAFTVLRFIMPEQRRAFIFWGVAGSLAGYLLWFRIAGPYFLP